MKTNSNVEIHIMETLFGRYSTEGSILSLLATISATFHASVMRNYARILKKSFEVDEKWRRITTLWNEIGLVKMPEIQKCRQH